MTDTDLLSIRSPAAKRRQHQEEIEEEHGIYRNLTESRESSIRTPEQNINENSQIEVPKKSYQVFNIAEKERNIIGRESILITTYNNTNAKRSNNETVQNVDKSLEMTNARVKSTPNETADNNLLFSRSFSSPDYSTLQVQPFKSAGSSFNIHNSLNNPNATQAHAVSPFDSSYLPVSQSHLETIFQMEQFQRDFHHSPSFRE